MALWSWWLPWLSQFVVSFISAQILDLKDFYAINILYGKLNWPLTCIRLLDERPVRNV